MRIVDVHTEGITLPYKDISTEKIKEIVISIYRILQLDAIESTIIITDNEYIQKINNEYRNKNYATDVISFAERDNPFPTIENEIENLGDIFISIIKADEQAVEYNISILDEMKRLLVHGVLHLLGYDHERSHEDEEIMHKKEDEVLQKLNSP